MMFFIGNNTMSLTSLFVVFVFPLSNVFMLFSVLVRFKFSFRICFRFPGTPAASRGSSSCPSLSLILSRKKIAEMPQSEAGVAGAFPHCLLKVRNTPTKHYDQGKNKQQTTSQGNHIISNKHDMWNIVLNYTL